jgi:hypothetical protein
MPGQLMELSQQAEMLMAAIYHEPAPKNEAAVAAE